MLKGLDPLLIPDLLQALAAMGHGDTIAIVDRNFPAYSLNNRVITMPGADVIEASTAIFSLLPIDTFVPAPITRMNVPGAAPEAIPDVQTAFIDLASQSAGRYLGVDAIERDTFYTQATEAFAIVQTGEARPYGCFLAVKGVLPEISPD